MKIVNTTSVFPPCWDPVNVLTRLAALGYDSLDIAFDYCVQEKDFPFMTDQYEAWAEMLRNQAEFHGISYTHAHAPFDVSERGELPERTLRCASLLGVKYMVVHPIWRTESGILTEDEKFLAINHKAILPLLELAENHGVILLSENLLWGASIRTQTIAHLVREVRSPWFGWCYDTGHAHALQDSLDNFRNVCCAPLSLHIHDNQGNGRDDHLIPGNGTLNWKEFLRSLKVVGYSGDFVLEAHHQPLDAPDEDRDKLLSDLLACSRQMTAYYDSLFSNKLTSI